MFYWWSIFIFCSIHILTVRHKKTVLWLCVPCGRYPRNYSQQSKTESIVDLLLAKILSRKLKIWNIRAQKVKSLPYIYWTKSRCIDVPEHVIFAAITFLFSSLCKKDVDRSSYSVAGLNMFPRPQTCLMWLAYLCRLGNNHSHGSTCCCQGCILNCTTDDSTSHFRWKSSMWEG